MDNFAIELQNNPQSDGYIVCYGPEGLGSLRLDYTNNDERLILLSATAQETHSNEMAIWIVPKGGALPDPYEEPSVEPEDDGDTPQETPEAEPLKKMQ